MRRVFLSAVVVGTVATAAMAVSPELGPTGAWRGPLAHSPLGRTITGCLGRVFTLRSDLNISDEQRQQIRGVIVSHRAEIASTVKSIRDKRVVLRDLVRSDNAEESKIRTAAEALGQAVGDAAVKAAKLRGEIAPLLNQGQRTKIDKFLMENDAAIDGFLATAAKGS